MIVGVDLNPGAQRAIGREASGITHFVNPTRDRGRPGAVSRQR
jgi:hypothetical protein